MCGFFFTNKKSKTKSWTFDDVKQRGFDYIEIEHEDCYALQSVMPTITDEINFSIYHTEDYIFLFTGEIYNFDRTKYTTDTQQVINDILNKSDTAYNGMYAYVFYNKHTKELKYQRDKTGQIPLFVYDHDGHVILSNTIKSIVKAIQPNPNLKSLDLWKSSKHFIFEETPWQGIKCVQPFSEEQDHHSPAPIKTLFANIKPNYQSYLSSASINSGGIDSGIVSKWFGEFEVAINHIGKDFVSNHLDFAYNITESEWCDYVDQFIESTYLFPYTWSWVGYYILGSKLKNKVNILYTGEGADEIFGGYPDYAKRIRTPYSKPFAIDETNFLVNNKLSDQKYFIPTAAMGANLALGCFTIEPRSPFLDRTILNNLAFRNEDDKRTLKKYYEDLYEIQPAPKQGFGGFPDEYGKSTTWKTACFDKLSTL